MSPRASRMIARCRFPRAADAHVPGQLRVSVQAPQADHAAHRCGQGAGTAPGSDQAGGAIPKFVEAAEELAPCLLVPTPAHDPLRARPASFDHRASQLRRRASRTIMGVIGGLALQIQSAQAAGNTELLAALECAQTKCKTSAQHVFSALDPSRVALVGRAVSRHCGVDPIKIPASPRPRTWPKSKRRSTPWIES